MTAMTRFDYSALSASGDIVTGHADGADESTIVAHLHNQGLLPIRAVAQTSTSLGGWTSRLRFGDTLARRDLALYSQQLARLLKAHLPLDRALEILASLAERRHLQKVMRATLERVRDGSGLAEAMEAQGRAFPPVYVSMVRAGEMGGALQQVVARAADFLRRTEEMRQKVVSALIYPAVLVVVASVSVALVLTVVLPEFAPLFREAGDRLPLSTRIVMAAGDILRDDWWILLGGAAVLALAMQRLMRMSRTALVRDRLVLALPILRDLVTRFEIGRFSRTFGELRTNGVPAPEALRLCGRTVGNRLIAEAIDQVATRFKEGESLSAALAATGRFPELSTQLIRIGEETGRLEEILNEVAEIYDQDVQRALERLLALLVPALTIGMGMIIAFIIAAVMTAMISINDLAR
jgi:general secretion pathway protein F